jgi:hypothetical protein
MPSESVSFVTLMPFSFQHMNGVPFMSYSVMIQSAPNDSALKLLQLVLKPAQPVSITAAAIHASGWRQTVFFTFFSVELRARKEQGTY